jgi:hypothetical protein
MEDICECNYEFYLDMLFFTLILNLWDETHGIKSAVF